MHVDEKVGHKWARELVKQEEAEASNPLFQQESTFYDSFKNDTCPRHITATQKPCGGLTCIRALAKRGKAWECLFVGYENYRHSEKGHHFIILRGHDPATVL